MQIDKRISKILRNVSYGERSRKAFMPANSSVIRLNSGDPSFTTPMHIRQAAFKAMNEGYTHYCAGLGDEQLRESICVSLEQDYGLKKLPNEILITNGAAEAITLVALSFLDTGEEAVIFDPSYSLYLVGIQAAGANPIPVPLSETFHYSEEELITRITPKTRLLFLCNPNNPTATCFSREDLESIAKIANEHKILVVSDEIYPKYVFDDRKHVCASSIEGLKDRVILINSFSKTYAMTGWRIGFIAASPEIIKALLPLHRALVGSVNTISQKAALAALQGPQDCVQNMLDEYEQRRRMIYSLVNEIDGLKCQMPEGAFYVFCHYEAEFNAEEMTKYLAENGVAVRSGTEFGKRGEKYIRIAFAASLETIERGMEKIAHALKLLE